LRDTTLTLVSIRMLYLYLAETIF